MLAWLIFSVKEPSKCGLLVLILSNLQFCQVYLSAVCQDGCFSIYSLTIFHFAFINVMFSNFLATVKYLNVSKCNLDFSMVQNELGRYFY